jgi:hypothetical protein
MRRLADRRIGPDDVIEGCRNHSVVDGRHGDIPYIAPIYAGNLTARQASHPIRVLLCVHWEWRHAECADGPVSLSEKRGASTVVIRRLSFAVDEIAVFPALAAAALFPFICLRAEA